MGSTVSTAGRQTTRAGGAPAALRLTPRGKFVFSLIPLLGVVVLVVWLGRGQQVTIEGIAPDATVGAAEVDVSFSTERPVENADVTVEVDGAGVPFELAGTSGTLTLAGLTEGAHRLEVIVAGRVFDSSAALDFNVDTTAPVVSVLGPTEAVRVTQPVTVSVSVDDAEATVLIGDSPAPLSDGVATLQLDRPPRVPVSVTATDPYGNATTVEVVVPLLLAGAPGQDPIRGVHATGYTWATPELRQPILDAIAAGLINTVQLDLKDEGGDIWYDTDVDLAHEIGAVTILWDLAQVVEELHALDVRVVGRIVNFRDPRLTAYAVETGKMDWVVQNPDGTSFGKYGGFTNPFNTEVWEYNIALAEEAARAGVDDIMYDYVRRPDQAIEDMVFPGQNGTPEDAIIGFLEASQGRIHAAGSRLAAAVFGIAATRPDEIAQDIPRISHVVDYVSPMVYPSHWGPGEYGVANPNAQPYEIVYASMLDFVEQTKPGGAGIVVWLQDFSLGVDYGPAEVKAQIDAAVAAGVPSFLLWDPKTTYTWAALGG
jgi:hypothetical protein